MGKEVSGGARGWGWGWRQPIRLGDDSPGLSIYSSRWEGGREGVSGWDGRGPGGQHHCAADRECRREASAEMKESWKSRWGWHE